MKLSRISKLRRARVHRVRKLPTQTVKLKTSDSKRPNALNVLNSALLLIPAISVIAANFYFIMLASKIEAIPVNAFDLQDHFNKAVDLLFPVFFILIGSLLFASLIIASDKDENYQIEDKPLSRYRTSTTIFLFLALYGFLVTSVENRWVDFTFLMLLVTPFMGSFGRFAVAAWTKRDPNSTESKWIVLSILLIGTFVIVLIRKFDLDYWEAIDKYSETGELVYVDKLSMGSLVIDENRFRVLNEQGDVLIEGKELPEKWEPIACRLGWKWSCRFTKERIVHGESKRTS